MTEPDPIHSGDPYKVLGVAPDASPDDVRKAYRQLLRKYRPEQDPAGFQSLRAAYDALQHGGWVYGDPDWNDEDFDDDEADDEAEAPAPETDASTEAPVVAVPDTMPAEWEDAALQDVGEHPGFDAADVEAVVEWQPPAGPDEAARRRLRALLRSLDEAGDQDAIPNALQDAMGDLQHRDPDTAASVAFEIVGGGGFSPAAYEKFLSWIEGLDCRAEWLLDRVEHLAASARLAEEVERAAGQTGYPDELLELLRDHENLYGDDLCEACAGIFEEDDVRSSEQYRRTKALRGYPLLWASFRRLRERLLDMTEGERSHRGATLLPRDARKVAWDLLRGMDEPIDKASDRPVQVAGALMFFFGIAVYRWLNVWGLLILIVGGVAVLIAVVRIAQHWAYHRYVLPRLMRLLPRRGLAVADVMWVLVERPGDFKHWSDVEEDLRRAVPLWLWSAQALRSEGDD